MGRAPAVGILQEVFLVLCASFHWLLCELQPLLYFRPQECGEEEECETSPVRAAEKPLTCQPCRERSLSINPLASGLEDILGFLRREGGRGRHTT